MPRRYVARVGILLVFLAFATQSGGFVRDTHYTLTFAMALTTCFDWDEAHLIASADAMIDRNRTTKAESNPLRKWAKVNWHAFGHSGERYHELWERVLAERDPDLQLVRFGQFLHFLQDWESHAGFGISLGHARATITGNDPDSMARSEVRTSGAAQATLEHMGRLCAHRGRLPTEIESADVALIDYFEDMIDEDVIEDLIESSNPGWRKGKTGGLNRLGKRILALNKERVEVFIEDYLKSNPENRVPADFEAGREDALPQPLELRYDGEGNLLNTVAESRAAHRDEEASGFVEGDSQLRVLEIRSLESGWRVRAEVRNAGGSPVPEDALSFVASNADTEEELGRVEKPVPRLSPGKAITVEATIPATRMTEDVLVSVALGEGDDSAIDDFAWSVEEDELEEMEREYRQEAAAAAAAREGAEVDVGFVRPPHAWVTSFGWLCATAVVRTDHKDPTWVLDPLEMDFVDREGVLSPIPRHYSRYWSITPEGGFVPPATKSYECLSPPEYCPALPDSEKEPALRFFAEAGAGENEILVPLEGPLGEDIRRTCEAAGREGYVAASDPTGEDPVGLRVLTFNVWHGRRSGESKTKFPGEEEERAERRFAWQIRLIQQLDPDILFFQEVNPNQREAETYARALRYDEIHKVTSCGIHLGAILKIPKNVNEGLAILARRGLRLRRVGTKRLSGNAMCTATFGFQTKESRYLLLGEITVEGRRILLATAHLSSPPYVPPGFEEGLADLVARGVLAEEQRGEIAERLESKRERNLDETRKLLAQIDKYRLKLGGDGRPVPVILGGDFNTEPETASIAAVEESGLRNVATGAGYLTWDPVRNHENQAIGSKKGWPVPTFDLEEVESLLEPRLTTARQIDYLFVSEEGEVVSSRMAMDEDRHGLFPSDHFAIFAVIDIDLDPPEMVADRARSGE